VVSYFRVAFFLQFIVRKTAVASKGAGLHGKMGGMNGKMPTTSTERPYGLCAGQFVTPSDFDSKLPENILEKFEGR
jgi:hypothetical protein